MTRLDQQLNIGVQEVPVHGDLRAIWQHELRRVSKFLDEAKNVIPAATVEPGGMVAQLPKDFVHLEGGQDSLDEHRGANAAARHAERILRVIEHVVPEASFQMAFHLRQIEIGAGALGY